MEQRLSVVTLGVADVARARAFYERLGWKARGPASGEVAFFQTGSLVLALYGGKDMARDAGVKTADPAGHGIVLAHNVREKDEVAALVDAWKSAGGSVTKAPADTSWGGHAACVADPDGHLWEIAWNPFWPLGENGEVSLP
ncbi:VOC family protein [Geminicoccaceae bacterium 1502E]|nr:VOC family protein [Geminicoccaceae bacterium 1502E]